MTRWPSLGLAAALIAAAGPWNGAAAQSAGVAVVRGSAATVEPGQRAGLPAVLRGAGAPAAASRPAASVGLYGAAGEVLWLIDAQGGVAACTLRGSGYAGRNAIDCAQGRLVR
jgi:hypothetical protein